jgi:hypothetical protein
MVFVQSYIRRSPFAFAVEKHVSDYRCRQAGVSMEVGTAGTSTTAGTPTGRGVVIPCTWYIRASTFVVFTFIILAFIFFRHHLLSLPAVIIHCSLSASSRSPGTVGMTPRAANTDF